jgi:hypothetical protein
LVDAHAGGFRPGIDPGRLNQLVDPLDVDDLTVEAGKRE